MGNMIFNSRSRWFLLGYPHKTKKSLSIVFSLILQIIRHHGIHFRQNDVPLLGNVKNTLKSSIEVDDIGNLLLDLFIP